MEECRMIFAMFAMLGLMFGVFVYLVYSALSTKDNDNDEV